MGENLSNDQAEKIQNTIDYDRQTPGGGEGGTTDTDDEEVFKNDTEAMKADDLEGLDPDADMDDDDGDLPEPGDNDDNDDSAENETLGTP